MKSISMMNDSQQINSNLIVFNDKRNQLNNIAYYQYLEDGVITVFREESV